MAFGLTPEGFVKKRLADIKTELEQSLTAVFGEIDLAPQSVFGQLIGITSKLVGDAWDQLEACYFSQYPVSAEGFSLSNVSEIVGISRLPATSTIATVSVTGTEGTIIPAGSRMAVEETNAQFLSTEEREITKDAIDVALLTVGVVLVGATYRITINAVDYDHVAIGGDTPTTIATALAAVVNAGVAPVIASPNGPIVGITVETGTESVALAVATVGGGTLALSAFSSPVPFRAHDAGPVLAPATMLSQIVTPVAGWTTGMNRITGITGRAMETDPQLRDRRRRSVRVIGAANADAITARLLQDVDGLLTVRIYQNRTDIVDAFGLPAHSMEAVIQGGVDQDIAEMIWTELKPAGIETHGNTSVPVVGADGLTHAVEFTRPTPVYIWVTVVLTLYPEEVFPVDGDASVAAAILAFGQTLTIGEDVIRQRFYGGIYASTPGIQLVDMTLATSATPGGPPGAYVNTPIAIGRTQIADFSAARIVVTH